MLRMKKIPSRDNLPTGTNCPMKRLTKRKYAMRSKKQWTTCRRSTAKYWS